MDTEDQLGVILMSALGISLHTLYGAQSKNMTLATAIILLENVYKEAYGITDADLFSINSEYCLSLLREEGVLDSQ